MAKDKSLKSELEGSVLKRKKLSSNDSEVQVEAVMDVKVKKKRKKTEVEVSNVVKHFSTLKSACDDAS